MIKIVGKAREAVKRIVCKNCATWLEYTQNEVKIYRGKDYSGGNDGKEWINCPKCGKEVIIRAW